MAKKKEVELGDRAKDQITGYVGIVTGVTVWLNGCRRFLLQGPIKKKDKTPDEGWWVDEGQVVVVQKQAFKRKVKKNEPPGGPTSRPSREKNPARR